MTTTTTTTARTYGWNSARYRAEDRTRAALAAVFPVDSDAAALCLPTDRVLADLTDDHTVTVALCPVDLERAADLMGLPYVDRRTLDSGDALEILEDLRSHSPEGYAAALEDLGAVDGQELADTLAALQRREYVSGFPVTLADVVDALVPLFGGVRTRGGVRNELGRAAGHILAGAR